LGRKCRKKEKKDTGRIGTGSNCKRDLLNNSGYTCCSVDPSILIMFALQRGHLAAGVVIFT